MKNLVSIDPIAVKDKNDVVKALTILEKLGIKIMTEEQKEIYLSDESRTVDNNYMVQDKDGGFGIQSHYLGFGISIESLEKQVNKIIEKHPDICERLIEIEKKKKDLLQEIEEKNQKLAGEINNVNIKIKEFETYSVIEIKEKI